MARDAWLHVPVVTTHGTLGFAFGTWTTAAAAGPQSTQAQSVTDGFQSCRDLALATRTFAGWSLHSVTRSVANDHRGDAGAVNAGVWTIQPQPLSLATPCAEWPAVVEARIPSHALWAFVSLLTPPGLPLRVPAADTAPGAAYLDAFAAAAAAVAAGSEREFGAVISVETQKWAVVHNFDDAKTPASPEPNAVVVRIGGRHMLLLLRAI
jgi:hypothetical protein